MRVMPNITLRAMVKLLCWTWFRYCAWGGRLGTRNHTPVINEGDCLHWWCKGVGTSSDGDGSFPEVMLAR